MKAYKVVRNVGSCLESLIVANESMFCIYKKGVVTKPRIKNSLLMVFKSLVAARRFAGNGGGYIEIWECEATDAKPLRRLCNPWCSVANIRRWWKLPGVERCRVVGNDYVPSGTYGATTVKLVRKVAKVA